MRLRSSYFAVLLLSLSALLSAQIQITAARALGGEVTLTFKEGNGKFSTISGRPFSAIDFLDQTSRDGTHVVLRADPIYRDSIGRTRTESRAYLPAAAKYFQYVEIVDPADGLQYVLDPAREIAYRIHVAISVRASATPKSCLAGKPNAGSLGDIATLNEALGSRIIDGVTVCGMRTTLTYPAGTPMFGNDRPVSTGGEHWEAWEELGRIVYSSDSHPTVGVTVGSLKNLRLDEPDPSLFRPPAGYRVVDESTEFTAILETPKPAKQEPRSVTALTGMSFSAEEMLSSEQILADGTKLANQVSTTKYFRDIAGRTRVERPGAGVDIVDPVAGYRYHIDAQKEVAVRAPIKATFGLAQAATVPAKREPASGEWLGERTIDGLTTYGMRHTTTFEAGSAGADGPTKMVTENWRSPQLGIDMIRKISGSRNVDLTTALRDLQFAEPDAALFRVPDGYRIEDDPNVVVQ